MSRQFSKGWGYKIDYDQAIAGDEAEIARLTNPALVGLIATLTDEERGWLNEGALTALDMLLVHDEALRDARLAAVGLTRTQAAQALVCWGGVHSDMPDQIAAELDPSVKFECGAFYREHGPVLNRLNDLRIITEERRKAELKQAKNSLSRHKRNKEKYGSK